MSYFGFQPKHFKEKDIAFYEYAHFCHDLQEKNLLFHFKVVCYGQYAFRQKLV